MEKSSKLINILIGLLLVSALAVTGFFGYVFLESRKKVVVPDFLGKNQKEVLDWCGQLESKYSCEIIREESKTVNQDIVFQQSLNAGSVLTDKITIRVSSELIKPVMLPQLYNAKKEDIEKWKKENGIVSVKYMEENSDTVDKGLVIRMEPTDSIYKDTEVTVYISSGKENKSDVIEVKSGEYVNLTVEQFEKQARELGLVANHLSSKDRKDDSVVKGNIVWHGSGTYAPGETINYGVCTEKSGSSSIKVSAGEYVGMTEDDFKRTAEDLGLSPNHKSEKDAYSDTVEKGCIVWHGSGTYVANETFNYGLSKGKKDGSSSADAIEVKMNAYVGKSESEFKEIAEDLGLKPLHVSDRDDYSNTIAKGKILTHGYGTYEKGEDFKYGLSLGKKDGSDPDEIEIESGTYVGKAESEFKTIAKDLGLSPNHKSEKDAYSDTVAKGSIVWHGSGIYEPGETFNYGLSKGKKDGSSSDKIEVSKGQYVGKSESEFIRIGNDLGLSPNHSSSRDAYSDTVEKGYIVWHGSGTYVPGETFNYGLSLGKSSSPSTVTVSSRKNDTEAEFKAYIEGLGLKLGTKTTEYSDTIDKGRIIRNDTGTFDVGDSIDYTVSLGESQQTGRIMRPEKYQQYNTYAETKAKMQQYLSVFTDVTFYEVTSKLGVGKIEKIEVGDYGSSYNEDDYPISTPIRVYIVSRQEN